MDIPKNLLEQQIYNTNIIHRTIQLPFIKINNNINSVINNYIKKNIINKCHRRIYYR